MNLSRRDFLKTLIKGTAFLAISAFTSPLRLNNRNVFAFAEPTSNTPDIYVLEGTNYKKLIQEGFNVLGGVDRFLKPGNYVVIKPNAAWSRKPEEAGNTHPDLVYETIRMCFSAGAKKVDVIEHTCDNSQSSFKISGIEEAVKHAGAKMISLSESKAFKEFTLPEAKILKKAEIASQVFEADCFINIPIAKSHSSATLTMSMKNHMGIVKDRGFFHSNGLHQCIADISSFVKPHLTILDCTRILLTNGPKGPGEVKVLNKIVLGTDQIAVDSLGATYFGYKPHDIGYIKIAGEMNIGKTDINKINILHKTIV
jgi:uncharacterized protein (DUF362 family)